MEPWTTREQEVLLLIDEGLTNQEIAHLLVVNTATIKTCISHIFSKSGARDRAAAIVYAYEHGIVIPSANSTTAETQSRLLPVNTHASVISNQ